MSQSMYSNPFSNQSKYVPCFKQDGKLYTWDSEGTSQIGVSLKTYQDIQAEHEDALVRLENYYKYLTAEQTCPHCQGVVPAIILPEPSAQDIIEQQKTQLRQAQEALAASQKTQQDLINGTVSLMQRVEELSASIATLTGGSNETVISDQPTSDSGLRPVQNKRSATKS